MEVRWGAAYCAASCSKRSPRPAHDYTWSWLGNRQVVVGLHFFHDALYDLLGRTHEVPFCIQRCFYFGSEVHPSGSGNSDGAGVDKVARGFEPTVTFSSHFLRHAQLDRAVRDFLEHEREAVDQHVAAARADGVLKPFEHAASIEARPSSSK